MPTLILGRAPTPEEKPCSPGSVLKHCQQVPELKEEALAGFCRRLRGDNMRTFSYRYQNHSKKPSKYYASKAFGWSVGGLGVCTEVSCLLSLV